MPFLCDSFCFASGQPRAAGSPTTQTMTAWPYALVTTGRISA